MPTDNHQGGFLSVQSAMACATASRRTPDAGHRDLGAAVSRILRRLPRPPSGACRTFQAKLIENRATRHNGYQISQKKRPLIEKAFGWMKQTGGMRKTKLRGFILLVLVDCQTGSDSEPVSTVLSNKMYGLKSALTGGWTEIFGSPQTARHERL